MSGAFFHKGISRLHSEELLLQAGEDGSFLVRDSESVTGAYVLCLLHQHRVHQYRILPDKDGKISVQSEGDMQPPSYNDLPSLIASYINRGDKNGLVCALRRPISPEGAEIPEADSEDEDFDESRHDSVSEDKNPASKGLKYGLLHNFARLDLSCCDGEFVDAMKSYVDEGLEKDASREDGTASGPDATGPVGTYHMPEFQKLIATAGKGLQRELDVFLLKLSMCHDMLSKEDDDKRRTLTSNPMDRLGSYIDFMAAKLENCRTQILALEKKAQEVMQEGKEEDGESYAYPDTDQVGVMGLDKAFLPVALRRNSSVSIPLSTFEVKVLKHGKGKANYKLKLTIDIHQGRFFAVKPSRDMLDSSNIFTHDKILQLVKNTTDNSRLHVIFNNKKKYTYQFESALLRESFCLQIRQMKSLHSEEQDIDNISIFIGTWNMGKSAPVESLKYWLKCCGEGKSKDRTLSRLPHDVYVIGTQESGMTEKDWINTIKAALKAALNLDVHLVESCSLWGLRTLVFVNPRNRNLISHVQKSYVRTGIANALGNKGAAAVSFFVSGTSFCFINAHLTSGEERLDRRNQNFRDILKSLSMGPKNLENYDVTHKFHHVFFFGDLNYRVSEPVEIVLRRAERKEYPQLLEHDQLRRCQFEKRAFFGFSEPEITFMPTYRLERQTPGYKYDWKKTKASGERINAPSWCDRILWNSFPGTFIENTAYGSVENLLNSDHRPVFGSFTVGVASPFIQNRASLQDVSVVKFVFKRIEAQIRTSTKQFYILEFSSACMPDIICCESNKRFGESQKAGFTMNPIWTADQLPLLRPLFGDADYLEDQHILIAVKGSGEDHESYGECVLSLKEMFTGEPCYFEATMTHFGEETGKLKGEWYISTGANFLASRASRKTYEIIALDTEYHDPEEFLSLSPPLDMAGVHHSNFFPATTATPSSPSSATTAAINLPPSPATATASSSPPSSSSSPATTTTTTAIPPLFFHNSSSSTTSAATTTNLQGSSNSNIPVGSGGSSSSSSSIAVHFSDEDPHQHHHPHPSSVPIPSHYVNHTVVRRVPSDPVPAIPESALEGLEDQPPPIPSKRVKTPLMGQFSLQSQPPQQSHPLPITSTSTTTSMTTSSAANTNNITPPSSVKGSPGSSIIKTALQQTQLGAFVSTPTNPNNANNQPPTPSSPLLLSSSAASPGVASAAATECPAPSNISSSSSSSTSSSSSSTSSHTTMPSAPPGDRGSSPGSDNIAAAVPNGSRVGPHTSGPGAKIDVPTALAHQQQHHQMQNSPSPTSSRTGIKPPALPAARKSSTDSSPRVTAPTSAWAESKVMPTAPPAPYPVENIYPSIAIRPYEELKKPSSVSEWLKGLGLSEYISTFLRHGWDSMSALPGLNAAAVMKMGIRNAEHRLRILNSVRDMKGCSN